MIMIDTCATHRSRVPRRSSGRIKGGASTVEDERGPGLDFSLCFVCGSRPWGAAALLLCLLICLLNFFECSPVPASFFPIYELCYIGAETREEGGTCCQKKPSLLRGIAVLRRSGSTEKRRPPVAARGGGAGTIADQVGRKARCWLLGRGGVAAVREGAEESAPFARRPEPAAIRHVWGGAGNGGLAAGCPRLEEPSPSARRRRSVRPSTKDVQYHRMAPRVRASQLVEDRAAACPGTGLRIFFFFFLSPLSRLCLSSSFRLLFSRLVCPYPQVRHGRRDRLPPREGGRGGVERSLGSTPRPARGDGGMWRVGRGREPWERSEAGGVDDNDRHLRHSPVSSPTEELRKDKRRSVDSGRRERTRPGF